MMLWTQKHRPASPDAICGQAEAVSQARRFLSGWKRGRGLIIHGPPGTGKTLLASLLAAERGDFLLHVDASDSLSAKNVTEILGDASVQKTLFHKGKIILIDEVDSLSGVADRGAGGAIVKIIERSAFPVIICANDLDDPKLKDIRKVCTRVAMEKAGRKDVEAFLRSIALKEGIKADDGVFSGLARWADGDVRSAVLDFQMLCAGRKHVTEDHFLSLGFRERKKALGEVLTALLRAGSLKAGRMALRNSDEDPDDVFIWLESNALAVSDEKPFIAGAYGALAIADSFRTMVARQQNWRFKAYMSDFMAGVSSYSSAELQKPQEWRYPDRIRLLAARRFQRASVEPLVERLCEELHCSRRDASVDYLPLLSFMARKGRSAIEALGLSEEEAGAIPAARKG